MKVLPLPGLLRSVISPPSRPTSSRLIDSPSPVPPYWRAVVPSAWANASKMRACSSASMPIPVSVTVIATTDGRGSSVSLAGLQPPSASADPHAHRRRAR